VSHPRPVITSTAPQINTTPQPTALLADEQALIRTSQITGISLPVLVNNVQLEPLNEHAHPLVTQEQVVTVNTKPSGTLQWEDVLNTAQDEYHVLEDYWTPSGKLRDSTSVSKREFQNFVNSTKQHINNLKIKGPPGTPSNISGGDVFKTRV
jgi:hypothetical protein